MLYERIVVKLGTSVLTGGTPHLHKPTMVELVRQCAALHASGRDIVLCSSGAIGAGRERLDFPDLPQTLASKQLLAAVGQSRLMHLWERYFEIYGLHVGQILLTRADAENRQRYLNARDTLLAMIEHGIVPIINENDAVSVDEIRVGDNDNLSAIVATLAGADLLLLLTDQKGLYTADPRNDPRAQQLRVIEDIDDDILALAGGSVSGLGVGGMTTKLQAAQVARRAGADVVIAAGKEPNIITRIVAGEAVGTRIPALAQTLDSRKQWILAGQTPNGAIVIDDGARKALCSNGSSLLPAGISRVEGRFLRGDTVSVVDRDDREFARGMTRYGSSDLARIAGAHSDAIEDILGYGYGPVAIHRNDLILM